MELSIFLRIASAISTVVGLPMVFVTGPLLSLYGMTLDRAGTTMAQWSGAGLIGLAIIGWYASRAEKSELLDGILLALFVCDSIGFVTSLMTQLAGISNALGWSTVGIWFLLALGFGYFRFIKKD